MNNVIATILGGGRGTRLFPLTLERAKPAISFIGKYRLIDIPASNCINSGIRRIFVLTQFMSASLHRHIMQTYQFDNFTDGFVDILAAEQTPYCSDWFQGTADAVRATLIHTTYYKFQQMLILSGDHLYRMNYSDLIRFHRENRADITLCVYPVNRREASRMGLLKVDNRGLVEEFIEKPQDLDIIERFIAPDHICQSKGSSIKHESCLASMGIYVFEPKILNEILADKSYTDFGKEVIPSAIGKYRVMAYPFSGYWKDIGTIPTFFEANISLAQANPPFKLYESGWPFYTRTISLPPVRVIKTDIRDSLLVEGSDITGSKIVDSIVGMRSIIRDGSCLKDVVMLGADFYEGDKVLGNLEKKQKDNIPPLGIGRNCVIERAIIDKNARIGDEVTIKAKSEIDEFQSENYWVRDGIVVIPKGAVIPSGTKI
ncbi:MAG: glucose-1-phosphate adenylyltransferase [bacterium]